MKTRMKASLIATAALFVIAGMAPAATATDGHITRSFNATFLAEVEFKDQGTGIYSSSEVCPSSLLGFRVGVIPDFIYYQRNREDVNLKVFEGTVIGLGTIPTGQPCPPPVGSGSLQDVVVEDMTVRAIVNTVSIDQLLCMQLSFQDCFPDPSLSNATLYRCDNPTFVKATPTDTKGFFAGTPAQGVLMSRSAECAPSSNGVVYYDGGVTGSQPYCRSWFFEVGNWGTDFCLIQVEDIIPAGDSVDDSGWIVTCMETTYTAIDFSTTPPTSTSGNRAISHDYKLILDSDNQGSWAGHQTVHNNNLDGWHDLGGDNGCPNKPTAPSPQPVKKGITIV